MEIQVTQDEIEKSYEFRWFKYRIKMNSIMSGILCCACLFLLLIVLLDAINAGVEKNRLLMIIAFSGGVTLIWALNAFFIFLYYKSKKDYLKKKYTRMKAYIVLFDSYSTSSYFPKSVFYEVVLRDKDKHVVGKYSTKPLFSSSFFSACSPDEVNNEYMIVLFDEKKEKVYVIRKARNEEIL